MAAFHRFRIYSVSLLAILVTLAADARSAGPQSAAERAQDVPKDAQRVPGMEEHFTQVTALHDAVIRGDLGAIKAPATWLAEHGGPTGLPADAAPYVAEMRRAAERAAAAPTVLAAAIATASMLEICGDCHRAVGAMPAAPAYAPPDGASGIVGHMRQHQLAADQMMQGLIVPSDSLWRAGAEGFRGAPLQPGHLPPDAKLTPELADSEERIHQLASQAVHAHDPAARSVFYGQILARCADCHALHRKIPRLAPPDGD